MSCCLVIALSGPVADMAGWVPGPLQLPYGHGDAPRLTDAALRKTYLQERVDEALYQRRWHRSDLDRAVGSSSIFAVEVLRSAEDLASDTALLVVHLELGPDGLTDFASCGSAKPLDARTEALLHGLLPPGLRIDGRARRPWTVAHATFEDGAPDLDPELGWSSHDQWLWFLTTATPFATYPPGEADHRLVTEQRRSLSGDWDVLCGRDGVAFVGSTPDDGGENFHQTAKVLVHTVYLDLFLLSRLQLLELNRLADDLSARGVSHLSRTPLHSLQYRLALFRKILWWQNVSVYGRANDLLDDIQERARLPQLLAQVVTDLGEVTAYAEAVAGRRTNALLALLTVIGMPFGVSFAGVITFGTPSPALFFWAVGSALLFAALLLLLIPSARGLLGELFRKEGVT